MERLSYNQIALAQQFLRRTVDAKSLVGQALIALSTRADLIVSSSRPFNSLAEIEYGFGSGSFADVLVAGTSADQQNAAPPVLLIWDNGYGWADVGESERGVYEEAFAPDLIQSVPGSKEDYDRGVKNALRRCRSFNPVAMLLNEGNCAHATSLPQKIRWAAVSCFDQEGAIFWHTR